MSTASLILNLLLKPSLYCVFLIFGKTYNFRFLFKFTYFWIYWLNSSIEENEREIFSKAPDWKPLFLLKIRNKKYNVIFEHLHQNIKACLRKKKSALINDWEKIIVYWEKSEESEVWVNKCGLLQIKLGVPGRQWNPGKTQQALFPFNLGNGIFST